MKLDILRRFCDVRSPFVHVTLTGLSLLVILTRLFQESDLAVTFNIAGLAAMVAISIPLTYWPIVQVHANIQLQRDGRLVTASVIDHVVNPSGFARWLLEMKVADGVVRKWAQSSSKLTLGSQVTVTLSSDFVHCRLEDKPTGSVWKTTLYCTTLLFISIADTIESLYCLVFGLAETVHLLRDEGCSGLNIFMHIMFAFIFGGAVLSNAYLCFWRRRYVGLPSIYSFEYVADEELTGGCPEYHALIA